MKLKRYSGRNLHDTEKKGRVRVTLDQVHRAVCRGEQVEVVEVGTLRDRTAVVYAQLLLLAAERGDALPLEKLRELVAGVPPRGDGGGELVKRIRSLLRDDSQRRLGRKSG